MFGRNSEVTRTDPESKQMGLVANVIPELKSGEMENFRTSEILAQTPNCEPPDQVNHGFSSERVITEPVEQKMVCGAQCMENVPLSLGESCTRINVKGQSLERGESKLEHADELSVPEKLEMPFESRSTDDRKMSIFAECSPINLDCGKSELMQTSAAVDSDHLQDKIVWTNMKSRSSKSKLKSAVTSSWVLRSISQDKPIASDKPIALETDDTMKTGNSNVEKRKKVRKRKRAKGGYVNEYSRTRSHLKYLLHRIKYEQSLIDAYSTEGWKGQCVEKLKPEKELQRARSHIIRDKLRIRDLFKNLDLSLIVGQLPESLFDSLGEIDSEDIFCAKCGSEDLSLENDIILCDGACKRGFHQYCLEPPLLKSQIPPDDEGWLCPGCDCKVDCIDILTDFQGANVSITDSWEKIFPEAVPVGKKTEDGSRSSDDSADDDYAERAPGDESASDKSNDSAASDDLAAAPNNDKYLGLPSDDSADDDFDPTASDKDKQVKPSSSSSDFTSDSDDLDALLDDAAMPGIDPGHASPSSNSKFLSIGSNEECPEAGGMKNRSLKAELAYLTKTSDELVSGKRPVERLDYKKLLEETYGDSSSDSSDEDFDDTAGYMRKKSNPGKTVVVSSDKSRTVKINADSKDEKWKDGMCSPIEMPNSLDDGSAVDSSTDAVPPSTGSKRKRLERLGEAASQRLYESFYENRFPSRAVKENLAKELGITVQKVTRWFANTRWSFNHRPKMGSNSSIEQELQVSNVDGNTHSKSVLEPNESDEVPAQSQTPETRVENFVHDSGVAEPRERKGEKDQEPCLKVDVQSLQPAISDSNRRRTRRSSKNIM